MAEGRKLIVPIWPATLRAIQKQARKNYPNECCGLVLRRPGKEKVRPIRNIQDELHARDPVNHPRSGRIAYYMEPKEVLDTQQTLEQGGWSLVAIYHSHPDHEAYFSQEDRDRAIAGEEPLYPTTAYFVIPLDSNRFGEMKAFRWNKEKRDFLEACIGSRSSKRTALREAR